MNVPDETLSSRPRIQVSVSADLLALVRRIGAVTGESDPQVVLRGLLQSLPAMLGDVDGLRARLPEPVKPASVPVLGQPGKHGKR
jgi:hypothetical protein